MPRRAWTSASLGLCRWRQHDAVGPATKALAGLGRRVARKPDKPGAVKRSMRLAHACDQRMGRCQHIAGLLPRLAHRDMRQTLIAKCADLDRPLTRPTAESWDRRRNGRSNEMKAFAMRLHRLGERGRLHT